MSNNVFLRGPELESTDMCVSWKYVCADIRFCQTSYLKLLRI